MYAFRYFLGILVTIGLIILVFVLIFGGSKPKVQAPPDLTTYANTDVAVQMTVDSFVSNPQTHRQVQVAVDKNSIILSTFKGYEGQVIKTKTYSNDSTSYGVFLRALDKAGYNKGNNASSLKDDRGVCPLGERYIFEVVENGSDIQRYWSSSCGKGNFLGSTNLVLNLFQNQAPDYNSFFQNNTL